MDSILDQSVNRVDREADQEIGGGQGVSLPDATRPLTSDWMAAHKEAALVPSWASAGLTSLLATNTLPPEMRTWEKLEGIVRPDSEVAELILPADRGRDLTAVWGNRDPLEHETEVLGDGGHVDSPMTLLVGCEEDVFVEVGNDEEGRNYSGTMRRKKLLRNDDEGLQRSQGHSRKEVLITEGGQRARATSVSVLSSFCISFWYSVCFSGDEGAHLVSSILLAILLEKIQVGLFSTPRLRR